MTQTHASVGPHGDLYVLQHSYEVNGCDETKLIGVYGSRESAEEAMARLREQPGFRDRAGDFHVDCYTLDEDHWTDGFASG